MENLEYCLFKLNSELYSEKDIQNRKRLYKRYFYSGCLYCDGHNKNCEKYAGVFKKIYQKSISE